MKGLGPKTLRQRAIRVILEGGVIDYLREIEYLKAVE